MEEQEGDYLCNAAMDIFECQLAFQTDLLQHGGGVTTPSQCGMFHFDLQPFVDRRSKRMGVHERHFRTRLRQTGNFVEHPHLATALQEALYRSINALLEDDIPNQDRLYFTLASDRLTNNYNGWGLTAGEWRQGGARVDEVLGHASKMLNSNERFEIDDSFQLSLTQVRAAPRGSGHKRKYTPGHSSHKVMRTMRKSIITISSDDQLCCARAIVTGKAKADNHAKWRSFKDGRQIQNDEAIKLHVEANIPLGPCGYEELTAFSHAPSLYDYQLLMIDADRNYLVTPFGPMKDKQIILLYKDGHYDTVTSLPGFFNRGYVCRLCFSCYDHAEQHFCSTDTTQCKCCFQKGCPDYTAAQPFGGQATLNCGLCHRRFFGAACLENHLTHSKNGQQASDQHKNVCTTYCKCQHCHMLLKSKKEQQRHRCGFAECRSCKKYVDISNHRCFIQKAKSPEEGKAEKKQKKRETECAAALGIQTIRTNGQKSDERLVSGEEDKEDKPPLHVFFDIEAMQVAGYHRANLIVAETEHNDHPVRFGGNDCLQEFLEWLDTLTEGDTRQVTVIAHNFQGYDGYFVIHQYLQENRKVEQIRNGAKILQMTFDNIRFIDSMSFFQMPLSAFPKTFGLKEMKKGYFPHLFNRREFQDYVGPLPAMDYYMPESMSVKGRQDFEEWYTEEKQKLGKEGFNLHNQLTQYCESDVKLLKRGCLIFRELFQRLANFNPFNHMTIASACNHDLRQNRMIPDSIASEPLYGWRLKTNQSKAALEWLHWEDHKLRHQTSAARSEEEGEMQDRLAEAYFEQPHPFTHHRLQFDRHQGEYRIPRTRYKVDGYDPTNKIVYEFQGCFWHGCPRCFPNREEIHHRNLGRNMRDTYEFTQKRMNELRANGYKVVEMWECDWTRLKREDKEIREFVKSLEWVDPLDPRDAFCGGRTNAVQLYRQVDKSLDEQIRYYDYTSLYPWVNKNAKYPVGHPEMISQPDDPEMDISQYFGLIKCTVLPPTNLYHPVLPYRHKGMLTFPLCGSCVKEQTDKPVLERSRFCPHSDDQRVLLGTWCSPELEKAVGYGYQVLRIHEVWHFENTCEGLFAEYVNTWLKLKVEASGWPKHVGEDEEKRQEYIQRFLQREGIQLDYTKIEYNPGLRTLAKMMLNSMWGKFGQRPNKTKVKEFQDPKPFHNFLDSDKYDVKSVNVLNEARVEVSYQHQALDDISSPNLNIFVACFTTCWARLRLYEALELLGERVLYFDTDSVIFVSQPGSPEPVLGDYLGDFTSELNEGDYIEEFVSGGPKNYAYKTHGGKHECKVRGFRLNSEGMQQLNYQVIRQNVLDEIQRPLPRPRQTQVTNSFQIVRDAKDYTLETHPDYKCYQLVFNKRVIDPASFQTYPYGFEQLAEEDEGMAVMLHDL